MPVNRRTFIGAAAGASVTYLIGSEAQAGAGVRKVLSLVETDAGHLQILRDAVAILKRKDEGANPAADGWVALSSPHVDHCFTNDAREIHFSWWFLPWHRAYLAAMEKRFQVVVGEPKLRLPYWNWFTTNQVPDAFTKATYKTTNGDTRPNPLFDTTRARNAAERADILGSPGTGFSGADALSITRRVLGNYRREFDLLNLANFSDLGGSSPSRDDSVSGAIETGPHGSIHAWVGGTRAMGSGQFGGNMSQAFSPRDPIFILHHGNIDRLWTVWKKMLGRQHLDSADPTWLNKQFPMPHPSGVGFESYRVGDLLDTLNLGYSYDVENIQAPSAGAAAPLPEGEVAIRAPITIIMNTKPLEVGIGLASTEMRSLPRLSGAPSPNAQREVSSISKIVLSGVTLPSHTSSFSIYLRSTEITQNTDDNLVAVQTVLNPTGRPLNSGKGINMVIAIPEQLQQLIARQEAISFDVVAGGSDRVVAPGPDAPRSASGISIMEFKLVIE